MWSLHGGCTGGGGLHTLVGASVCLSMTAAVCQSPLCDAVGYCDWHSHARRTPVVFPSCFVTVWSGNGREGKGADFSVCTSWCV